MLRQLGHMTESNKLLQINTIPFIQGGFMNTLITHLQIIMMKSEMIKFLNLDNHY